MVHRPLSEFRLVATLRDRIAKIPEDANFALLLFPNGEGRLQLAYWGELTPEDVARCLYEMADTMVKQRCKPIRFAQGNSIH